MQVPVTRHGNHIKNTSKFCFKENSNLIFKNLVVCWLGVMTALKLYIDNFTEDDCNSVLISVSAASSKVINSHSGGAFLMEASILLTF